MPISAMRLSTDPYFAYHAGLRIHVSAFGLYGFAALSSPEAHAKVLIDPASAATEPEPVAAAG